MRGEPMLSNSCWPSLRWPRLAFGAALCLALAGVASPGLAQTSWRDELPQARAVGGGELRWFGLRIYHATLWSEKQPFDPAARFALQLRYHRSISRDRLVQTSMEEIRRLGNAPRDAATLQRWEARLREAFVDVADGDQLVGLHLPGQGMRLYDQHRLRAEIADPQLAQAFFDIWLHTDSRDQNLRRQLLGGQP